MAKYFITKPALVGNQYIEASVSDPQTVEFPNDVAPSRTWEPLDQDAVEALADLGCTKEIFDPQSRVGVSLAHVYPKGAAEKPEKAENKHPAPTKGAAEKPEKVK